MNFTYPMTAVETIPVGFKMFGEDHRVATIWKFSVATLMAAAGIAFYMLMTEGHAAYNTANDGITWGLQIVAYAFLALVSTGMTFVASIAMVFGGKEFYPIVKRCLWLAIVALLAGFISLGLELGHPLRLLWAAPTGMQIKSPMFWMGNFYGIYLVALVLKFRAVYRGDWDSPLSKALGAAAFVIAVAALSMHGGLFGYLSMREMWFGPLIPIYFLMNGALAGVAFVVLFTYLAYGNEEAMPDNVRSLILGIVTKTFTPLLGIVFIATLSRMFIGLWSNADGLEVWYYLIRAPLAWIDNIFMLVAFVMLIRGSKPLVPALLVIVTLATGRYEFIIAGQMIPMFKGSWAPLLIQYLPSLTEWAITVMSCAFLFAGWAFGERTLNLGATPKD